MYIKNSSRIPVELIGFRAGSQKDQSTSRNSARMAVPGAITGGFMNSKAPQSGALEFN
jgi:hypothetical protein